jgi:hypothetical protein
MTEAEWLKSTNPKSLLEFLGRNFSRRKLRLFAVACCKRAIHLLTEKDLRNDCLEALDASERFSDGQIEEGELLQKWRAIFGVDEVGRETKRSEVRATPQINLVSGVSVAAGVEWQQGRAELAAHNMILGMRGLESRRAAAQEKEAQADILRDIFANPFRPTTINPDWLTPNVVTLAQTIYDERTFDGLPAIADALIDAGCDNQDVLEHCRSEGPHVRGCWVVDVVLGKE